MRRGIRIVAVTGAAVSTFAGCTSSGPPTVSSLVVSYARGPAPANAPRPSGPRSDKPFAAWDSSGRIYVVTYGSGSCPALPADVRVHGRHRIHIHTREHSGSDQPCTGDLGPTTSVVRLPRSIDQHAPIAVTISDLADVNETTTVVVPR